MIVGIDVADSRLNDRVAAAEARELADVDAAPLQRDAKPTCVPDGVDLCVADPLELLISVLQEILVVENAAGKAVEPRGDDHGVRCDEYCPNLALGVFGLTGNDLSDCQEVLIPVFEKEPGTARRDFRILRNCFKIRAHSPDIGRADAHLSRRMGKEYC